MNVKFINPFVEAAFEVLHAETNLNVSRGELGLENSLRHRRCHRDHQFSGSGGGHSFL